MAALLEDPLFNAAWDGIKAELMDHWLNSPVRDKEGREHLFMLVRLLENLRAAFVTHVESGKVSRDNLLALERERAVNRI